MRVTSSWSLTAIHALAPPSGLCTIARRVLSLLLLLLLSLLLTLIVYNLPIRKGVSVVLDVFDGG
jgi:hypothetical protein